MPTIDDDELDPAIDDDHEEAEGVVGDDGGEDDEDVSGGGLVVSWFQLVALVLAFAFLGGAIVSFWGDRQPSATGVDVGFYQDMSSHHEQAIQMALMELDRGTDDTVLSFAKEILVFQNRELGIMDRRLDDWGIAAGNRPPMAMEWMATMGAVPVDEMPGMADEAELERLDAADGAEADALFLDLMAEHHRGGIHMAQYAAEHASRSDVRALAERMARQQAGEVNEMAQTAERLGYDVHIEPVVIPD